MRSFGRAARMVVPPALSVEVDRPALRAVLDRAAQGRLTIVSAGPGWGKTTAVANWARNRNDHGQSSVAWLSLDRADDSPVEFWGLFLQAIAACGALPPGHPLTQISVSGGVSDEVQLSLFRALATLDEPLLVVIDDFHIVEDSENLSAVADLVSYDLPVNLVLLTRFDPPLPLHRLRASGALTEITARDLAFDAGAVTALAAQVESLSLSADQVGSVLGRTEGWPTGVRLATLQMSGSNAAAPEDAATGVEKSIAEYLTAEVLARHAPDMRDFLLRTSVADLLTGPLADAIAPGGQALSRLEQLERANQFVIAVDPERTTFRYHPLFRDMLVSQLRRDDPAAFRDSHRAAARWLVAHGDAFAALRHAVTVEDWDLALEVFVEASPSLVGALRFRLRSLLREIPFDALPRSAAASLCAASLEFSSGHLYAMEEQVSETRRRLAEGDALSPAALGLLENLAAAAARVNGDDEAAAIAAQAALEHTSKAQPGHGAEGQRLIATIQSGVALLRAGDTVTARGRFLTTIADQSQEDVDLAILGARAHIAWIDMVEGHLHDAHRGARAVIEEATVRGWTSMLQARYAYETLAAINDVWGNHDAADRNVVSAYAAEIGGVETWTTMALGIIQASIAVSRNRPKLAVSSLAKARAVGRDGRISPALTRPMTRAETDVAILVGDLGGGRRDSEPVPSMDDSATTVASRARLCLARGELAAAEKLARRVPRPPGSDRLDDVLAAVEASLVLGQVAHDRGDLLAAQSAVYVALELARPQRMLRPFLVLLPNGIAALTRSLQSLAQEGDEFAAALLEALARTGRAVADRVEPEPLIEPLTERELAILAELPSMSSNDEIAARYYVSVNTIKSHLKHMYRKLEVSNRREAVRRGRELGLIS